MEDSDGRFGSFGWFRRINKLYVVYIESRKGTHTPRLRVSIWENSRFGMIKERVVRNSWFQELTLMCQWEWFLFMSWVPLFRIALTYWSCYCVVVCVDDNYDIAAMVVDFARALLVCHVYYAFLRRSHYSLYSLFWVVFSLSALPFCYFNYFLHVIMIIDLVSSLSLLSANITHEPQPSKPRVASSLIPLGV